MTGPAHRSVENWRTAHERIDTAGETSESLRASRREAWRAFLEQGLPTRRLEAWKYTSLAQVEKIEWSGPVAAKDGLETLPETPLNGGAIARWALVDGHFITPPESPAAQAGFRCESIATLRTQPNSDHALSAVLGQLADPKVNALTALNTALLEDGALIEIDRGADVAGMLHLTLLDSKPKTLTCPRIAILARAGSRSTLMIEHRTNGGGPRLGACVSEVIVEDNAELNLVVVQDEGNESFLTSNLYARQGRDGRLRVHTFTLGGQLVRNEIENVLADGGADVELRGLFVGTHHRHIDHRTTVDHAVSHSTSNELYKGILGQASRGVFCGRVIVRPDAQKTDSRQSNPNLLLGEKSEINTQPQLEIYADDVKCSHGSTIGRLDEEALFYLRARGIGAEAAQAILTRGFAQEIVEGVTDPAAQKQLSEQVARCLETATGAPVGETS